MLFTTEEVRPEDVEELLQELEEEYTVEEALAPEVERLLQDLRPPSLYTARQHAAKELGILSESHLRIAKALVAAGGQ